MFKQFMIAALLVLAAAQAVAANVDVTLSAPNGTSYTAPATIALSASAVSNVPGSPITQVQFLSGRTVLGTVTQAPYDLNWTNVAAGSHTVIAVASNGDGDTATSAPVSIHVNTPPKINLTSPANNASYNSPANITLAATASDADGTIASVAFYQGSTLIGAATSAPYTVNWNNPAAGNYIIIAKATDNQGAVTSSNAINLSVNAAPTVSLTAPANNAGYSSPAAVALAAAASDTDGTIAKVEFYQGSTLIGTAVSAPYTFNWNTSAAGNYLLIAKATDNKGAAATSGAISISISTDRADSGNVPPSVSVSAPADNAGYTAPANVAITANAADADGTVVKVEFFNGATLIGAATAAPYAVSWNDAASGKYVITAKATDDQGAVTTSAPINISINAPPTVSLIAPESDATYVAPASITLTVNASDSDGSISQVAFYNGTAFIGSTSTAPYSLDWPDVAAGSYSVTAVATDNLGATATSNAAGFWVINNTPPTVSLNADPANAAAPATITLSATATDTDGSIVKVEFFHGAALLATLTQPPYAYQWDNVAAGSYAVTAKATDNLGGSKTSNAVAITVSGAAAQVTQMYYIHSDHLNTPRLITDENNNVVWEWKNDDPFGNNVPTASAAFEFNLRFPGQYFDKETSLFYNYFRDYDPATGRYVQSDPIGLAAGPNTYAYVGGNPISRTDPSGLLAQALPGAVVIGGIGCYLTPGCRNALSELGKSLVKAAGDFCASTGDDGDKPSIVDPKGEGHILDGDATGGGHRPGTGQPGKSEFPSGWTDERILGEISDVATDPNSTRALGRGGRTIVEGTRDGIDIRVVVDPNGRIITGFPTNVPRNP